MRRVIPLAVLWIAAASSMASESAMPTHDARLASHANLTCAIGHGGRVACWEGAFNGRGPQLVEGVSKARSLSVFGRSACAVTQEDTLACWGENHYGQLGRQPRVPEEYWPKAEVVSSLHAVQEVVLNEHFACALTRAGQVYCWGENRNGQLGDGTHAERQGPVAVEGKIDAIHIAASSLGACAILRGGSVTCWGILPTTPLYGVTGGSLKDNPHPHKIPGIGDARELSMGDKHVCVLRAKGKVACWGSNDSGQLGLEHRATLTPVSPYDWRDDEQYLPLQEVSELVSANETICAVTQGTVRCWGNFGWETGLVPLQGSKGAHDIESMRGAHSLAMATGSELCGITQTASVVCPNPLTTKIEQVEQLVAGSGHFCALLAGERLACWNIDRDAKGVVTKVFPDVDH